MWRRLTPLLLLASFGCGVGENANDVCASQQESYRVTARVHLSRGSSESLEGPGTLLVSVWEDSSIISCEDDLIGEVTPGNTLLDNVPAEADGNSFVVEVPATVYPNLHASRLWMQVLVDENGNGACDDGELMGGAYVEREPQSQVELVLSRQPCLFRL